MATLSGLLAVQHGLDMLESNVATKKKTTTEKEMEREALKKEKEAHTMRLLEAKAKIFPQFVADYYDAKKAGDDARLRATLKVCRDVYRELPLICAGHWTASFRTRNKFCELAIRETDAYLRRRFSKSTDLKHRTRLAKLLRRVDGTSWMHLACNYRGVHYQREYPSEEEIISWPGLVGFPDPK